MNTRSDILIVFSPPLDANGVRRAKAVLMDAGRSVIVHQKEGQSRMFLVHFETEETGPSQLLDAVRNAGFAASMAGG